ncbi:polynucleotide adenylyltransferase PcnB [Desulfomicrobium sp. ZS1]|uniref:polynucleotide adenylyltransferase PcnB n=1 Tax=Desulfomicrobium sp. ZS1 TaxID=2952228 RepID=UPI0020B22E89|nr:polynucleotide adenylyltransferase PcnB [Desulfomicrobium sp. ZS1]UTF51587.1 polynucleotide adenylyltransferase PcnB [Desulfomicrobium sp. ZS1]
MTSVIIPRSEHSVSRQNIHPDALKVMYRLVRKGFTAYLVGGGVRDLLLGRTPKDFDVSTNATPSQIKKIFQNCFLIGRRFRLAHIRFDDHVIETSTFRRCPDQEEENSDEDLYMLRDNCYGTPEEDALRRDFTINGLFYEVERFSIIDHVGGLSDIENRLIRCIGDPNIRFREDPVRMIRAVRFAARLDFHIEPATYNAIMRHHEEILKASPPRVFEELQKLFAYGSGEKAVRLLYKTGLLHNLLPEIADFLDHDHGQDSILWTWLEHLDSRIRTVGKVEPVLVFAALFSAPVRHIVARYEVEGERVVYNAMLEDLLQPICVRMSMPKWMCSRMIQIMANQTRFEPDKKKRFSKRGFVAHECFPETLALYQLGLLVSGADLGPAEMWSSLRSEMEAENPQVLRTDPRGQQGRPPRKRPPRRRRR